MTCIHIYHLAKVSLDYITYHVWYLHNQEISWKKVYQKQHIQLNESTDKTHTQTSIWKYSENTVDQNDVFYSGIDELYLNVSSMYTGKLILTTSLKNETKDLSIKQICLENKRGHWMASPKVSEVDGIVWLHTQCRLAPIS